MTFLRRPPPPPPAVNAPVSRADLIVELTARARELGWSPFGAGSDGVLLSILFREDEAPDARSAP